MFCSETIKKVYIGVVEEEDLRDKGFLDCYKEIAYHCTEGDRIILVTENFAISLSKDGVLKESRENLREAEGEYIYDTVTIEDGEAPWVEFEHTFFVGERILSVNKEKNGFLIKFDDFLLKIIPHEPGENLANMACADTRQHRVILGVERYLKKKCPLCGGEGQIVIDFVNDYLVRCRACKKSTWAGMNLIDAIEDWNAGELHCEVTDESIDE